MPHPWALVDSSFPTFTQGEKPQEQITALVDYMMILTEALKYQLENLDTNNWNVTALDNFQIDTTKDVSQQIADIAGKLSAVISELQEQKNTLVAVEVRASQMETELSYLQAGQEKAQGDIDELQQQMGTAQADIDELQQKTETAEGDIDELQQQMGTAQADIDELQQKTETAEGDIDELQQQMNTAQSDIEKLQGEVNNQKQAVQTDDAGNVTVGKEGKDVYLYGNVYINGVLVQ